MELTPSNVVSFCEEATLLNSLRHTNIVMCFGVAVMPPALCLVRPFVYTDCATQLYYTCDGPINFIIIMIFCFRSPSIKGLMPFGVIRVDSPHF